AATVTVRFLWWWCLATTIPATIPPTTTIASARSQGQSSRSAGGSSGGSAGGGGAGGGPAPGLDGAGGSACTTEEIPRQSRLQPVRPGRPTRTEEGGQEMANELKGKRVAIVATDMVEQVELVKPRKALDEAGARTDLISIEPGEIQGFNHY